MSGTSSTTSAGRPHPDAADVLVVGYGPVGQVLAILLARQGRRVTVVERWETPYPMPRATVFDGETARTLASLGIASSFEEIGEPVDAYDWRNAAGRTLLRMEFAAPGAHGWPDATTFHQPALEAALAERAAEFEDRGLLRVLRGHTATAVEDHGDHGVTLTAETAAGDVRTLEGAWLVGCDGANSRIRDLLDVGVTDLDFSFDWLLCDVVLGEPREFTPANAQICDPARPTTVVGSGPGRRRWEFMRLPDESKEELDTPETAWRLLKSFDVTPENAVLARHTVYTFRAALADTWKKGRVLLAGDAAHSMPPFAGAGMCSGIRDVLNLSWKLDRVLRGASDARLLDTYGPERRGHVLRTIELSVQLGKIVCVSDAEEAARRDATLTAGQTPDRPVTQPLREGVLHRTVGTVAAPPTGSPVPQGRVARDGVAGLFDQVVGTGFVLLTTEDPASALSAEQRALLAEIGAHTVRLASGTEPAAGAVTDLDDVYLPFMASVRARFVLVRPDFHVFGVARSTRELGMVLDQLETQLMTTGAGHPPRH
ncbi:MULTISPECIES: bifunctional 3-(3-hydroxy-phenyl)propionate/3-hydroxycinnamic acid hydroxylase [Streptomyces]|uniref:3-(3-hydroxyphenyl)propionate hydroxylase n=1 Tax=Streptomyces viridochromogenes TaxID=1938 RepID=A0A0L8J0V8_STRVR|nr:MULTISPECIES: bifunctional 3-(3-hydroxy-phenyl)propionate/3-hydroxycinnamic acid hydroxylase [Streptomyces]KOG07301.1 3-(3-hydroxyphenyl)propionate hydroxylase [Streptomyces viridochromogenes]